MDSADGRSKQAENAANIQKRVENDDHAWERIEF